MKIIDQINIEMKNIYLYSTIIVLIIIIFYFARQTKHNKYESGMWVGDSSFLEQSQLQGMQIFLAPPSSSTRQGYLIMVNSRDEFIANCAIEVKESWPSLFQGGYEKKIHITSDMPLPFPEELTMKLSIADGNMVLSDNKKIYAFLWKDLATSHAAIDVYNSI